MYTLYVFIRHTNFRSWLTDVDWEWSEHIWGVRWSLVWFSLDVVLGRTTYTPMMGHFHQGKQPHAVTYFANVFGCCITVFELSSCHARDQIELQISRERSTDTRLHLRAGKAWKWSEGSVFLVPGPYDKDKDNHQFMINIIRYSFATWKCNKNTTGKKKKKQHRTCQGAVHTWKWKWSACLMMWRPARGAILFKDAKGQMSPKIDQTENWLVV